MSPSEAYSELVKRHFAAPHHAGRLAHAHEAELHGAAGDREHGTEVVFHVGVDGGVMSEVMFQAFGCPHTIAACSLVTERLAGQPVAALGDLRPVELAGRLDLPTDKLGRLLIIEDALRRCLGAWDNRRLARR